MELFRWGNFSTLHLFRSHLIIRADRGGSRPRLYVRDSTLLHDDLHDLHRVRKCCGRDGQREMLHCLHDDRLLPPLRRHLRARDDHHPQHDPGHGQVSRDAGRGEGVHDPERGAEEPDGESSGLRCVQVDEHQGSGAGQSAQYLSKGYEGRHLRSPQQVKLELSVLHISKIDTMLFFKFNL